jgi:hypothetical protein
MGARFDKGLGRPVIEQLGLGSNREAHGRPAACASEEASIGIVILSKSEPPSPDGRRPDRSSLIQFRREATLSTDKPAGWCPCGGSLKQHQLRICE